MPIKRPKSPEVVRAIAAAGGLGPLAAGLGISRQSVSHWYVIPADRVQAVERITGIPREELRPDLYTRLGG